MDLVTALALCTVAAGGTVWHTPHLDHVHDAAPFALVQARSIDRVSSSATQPVDKSDATSMLDRWQPFITEAARRFDIPEEWIRSVMRAESGGRTTLFGQPITSRAGAMGLMQVMPETYDALRRRYGLGADPFDPRDNTLAGAAYLREMHDRYGYPGVFAAYNAGPDRFDEYLLHGVDLPNETWRYLAAIAPGVSQSLRAESPSPHATTNRAVGFSSGTALFFKIGPGSTAAFASVQSISHGLHSDTLFVPLTEHQKIAPGR